MSKSDHQALPEPAKMARRHPEEFDFFRDVFAWAGGAAPCFQRRFYEKTLVEKLSIEKWQPICKSGGEHQPLYRGLVHQLVEKHLDFEGYCRSHGDRDHLKPPYWETAFWFGTVGAKRTRSHAIDIDLHDKIGWYRVPTRHASGPRGINEPYGARFLPVPRPTLRFYQIAKLVHSAFPGRLWALSSGTLGLNVWRLFAEPILTHVARQQAATRMLVEGIPELEHYPYPAVTDATKGRCHRRPCGMDSGVLASTGLIVDPVQQIRCFMQPGPTPDFPRIIDIHIELLNQAYQAFLETGEDIDHGKLSDQERLFRVQQCQEVIQEVRDWQQQGCRVDLHTPRNDTSSGERSTSKATSIKASTGGGERTGDTRSRNSIFKDGEIPDSFLAVDLATIRRNRQFLSFVKFLVEFGIPAEDKFFEIISVLARWFLFVEFYGQDQSKTTDILKVYVRKSNNGRVSRIEEGHLADVDSHIDRIVKRVLAKFDSESAFFKNLRTKRESWQYTDRWEFSAKILGDQTENVVEANPPLRNLDEGIVLKNRDREWIYYPDETPLPNFATERIFAEYRRLGKRLNKRHGDYPVIRAVTRFFNHLLAGTPRGKRRCSRQLLEAMGFDRRGKQRTFVLNLLKSAGLITSDQYRARGQSIQWTLLDAHRYLEHQQLLLETIVVTATQSNLDAEATCEASRTSKRRVKTPTVPTCAVPAKDQKNCG